jgi:hypothetical protein
MGHKWKRSSRLSKVSLFSERSYCSCRSQSSCPLPSYCTFHSAFISFSFIVLLSQYLPPSHTHTQSLWLLIANLFCAAQIWLCGGSWKIGLHYFQRNIMALLLSLLCLWVSCPSTSSKTTHIHRLFQLILRGCEVHQECFLDFIWCRKEWMARMQLHSHNVFNNSQQKH